MNLELLKPKIKLIEGIPAFNYGEWPGQHSNKFKGAKSCSRPIAPYNILVSSNCKNHILINLIFILIFWILIVPHTEAYRCPIRKIPRPEHIQDDNRPHIKYIHKASNSRDYKLTEISVFERHKDFNNKLNYYTKREEYIKHLEEKQKKSEKKSIIKDEISFLAQMGVYTTEKEINRITDQSKPLHKLI